MVQNKVNHKFAFPQLEWDVKENLQRLFAFSILLHQCRKIGKIVHLYNHLWMTCIKLSFFFKKLPTVDDDHFQMHYNHVHSDLTLASKGFNVYKVQRYVQLIQTPEMKKKIQSLGMDLLDYDAVSTIWVRSWEDWERFSGSPEYAAALMPDAGNFMDLAQGIKVMAGHDMIVFGKGIPDVDAKDGMTRATEKL